MMQDVQINRFVIAAFAFEAALGAAAIVAGLVLGIDPLESVRSAKNGFASHGLAALWGVVGTLPLLLGLAFVTRSKLEPIVRLTSFVRERIVPLFAPLSLFELAAISLAAGFGEEALFRGLIQAGLDLTIDGTGGTAFAIIVSSLLFGVCHWITPAYALLAGLASIYFGLLFLWSGNLLTPIVAHALYDFLALAYLTASGATAGARNDSGPTA
jgi:membrane protease YdiL (CAAX protease family)